MTVGGISPQAAVDSAAIVAENVTVGPFCVIGPEVVLGEGVRLMSHVSIEGPTEVGPGTVISPFTALGGAPQDTKYGGQPTRLVIGARNLIREGVTVSRGTPGGGGVTRLGNDNMLMAYAHIGHDCQVGNRNILANAATLAGHVEVGSDTMIGAFSGVHQFCRVADHAFIGGYSVITQDALPWVTTVGNRAKAYGLNMLGLRRRGYPDATIRALKRTYSTLFRSKLRLDEALERVEKESAEIAEVRYFVDFVRGSSRGVIR